MELRHIRYFKAVAEEKASQSRGAAGDRAAALKPSDPGSGGGTGDDIVPSDAP